MSLSVFDVFVGSVFFPPLIFNYTTQSTMEKYDGAYPLTIHLDLPQDLDI
jgi:hypothetical protein